MFAWILNTNAEKSVVMGSMIWSPAILGSGVGASFKKYFKKFSTPKLLRADPKKTGVRSPYLFKIKLIHGSFYKFYLFLKFFMCLLTYYIIK